MNDYAPKFATLNDLYTSSIQSYGPRPLFGTKRDGTWQWTSYAEFGEKVDRLRGGLAALGVTSDTRVALISDNREEWAIVAYAAYGLGAAIVPMYEAQTTANWRYVIADSGASVVVVPDDEIAQRVETFRDQLAVPIQVVVMGSNGESSSLALHELYERGASSPTSIRNVAPDHIAGFVYTSGTTGDPKGVLLTHGNLASNVSAITEVFTLEPDDRSVSFLPWAHAFGQTVELHTLFSVGGSTAFAQSVRTLVADIAEVRPTTLVSVPRIFNRIYDQVTQTAAKRGGISKWLFDQALANEARRRDLDAEGRTSTVAELKHRVLDRLVFARIRGRFGGRLRYAISGGAAISREVAEFIDSLGIVVYEGYGLSETSPIVTANWPNSRKLGSVGRPIPGVQVAIDPAFGEDPEEGEVIVHGHCVMAGYHNMPEETARVITEDGGFRTGDLGRVDSDGFLHITGRVKDQFKLENGKYVVPGPIEERLGLSPYLSTAVVYGHNRPFNVALVVVDEHAVREWAAANSVDLGGSELGDHPLVHQLIEDEVGRLSSDVAGYAIPRQVVITTEEFTTDNGLLTPTLKVRRQAVVDHYAADIDAAYAG